MSTFANFQAQKLIGDIQCRDANNRWPADVMGFLDRKLHETDALQALLALSKMLKCFSRDNGSEQQKCWRWLRDELNVRHASEERIVHAEDLPMEERYETLALHLRWLELASRAELTCADWIELAGVGLGIHEPFEVSLEFVRFTPWKKDFIEPWPKCEQSKMIRDNEVKPLNFPCTPLALFNFVDNLPDFGWVELPKVFRNAVRTQCDLDPLAPRVAKPGNVKRKATTAKQVILAHLRAILPTHHGTVEMLYEDLRANSGAEDSPFIKSRNKYENLVSKVDVKGKDLKTIRNYISEIRQ